MTERLYYIDSYTREFEARVLECRALEKGYALLLDRTAFFPEGGGQLADTGRIGAARVSNEQMQEDGFAVGDAVYINEDGEIEQLREDEDE